MVKTTALNVGRRRILQATVASTVVLFPVFAFAQQPCTPPMPFISSPTPPIDVSDSSEVDNCRNGTSFFDDFSWRSFIALIWPAAQGQRGVPDATLTNFPVSGPLVFETYKADWETFPPPASPNPPPKPSPWTSFAGTVNPCGSSVDIGWGDMALASYTKFGNLGLADFGPAFIGPVISSGFSQNPNQQEYLRFQASYNKTEHDEILANQWYLQSKIGSLTFCSNGATLGGKPCPSENSIDLKSAWMDVASVPANLRSRYYIKKAWVLDPTSNSCTRRDMALIGLHIVSKTPTRPQWIWSTFEQIDNVPPVPGATPTTNSVFNLNDGKGAAMPGNDPYCVQGNPNNTCPNQQPPSDVMPSDASQAVRFNVTRQVNIDSSTAATNSSYQKLLASVAPNSPWQYYQLVMTQWPDPGSTPLQPGTPMFTIPGKFTPVTSSFSNVTMETFYQNDVFSGCMNCHNRTAHISKPSDGSTPGNDFLWSLAVNAYPDVAGPAIAEAGAVRQNRFNPSSSAAFQSLNALLRSVGSH